MALFSNPAIHEFSHVTLIPELLNSVYSIPSKSQALGQALEKKGLVGVFYTLEERWAGESGPAEGCGKCRDGAIGRLFIEIRGQHLNVILERRSLFEW